MTEEEFGRMMQEAEWADGKRPKLPPTGYKNTPLDFDEADLRRRIRSGQSMRAIAKAFGTSSGRIASFIRRQGISVKDLRKEGAA